MLFGAAAVTVAGGLFYYANVRWGFLKFLGEGGAPWVAFFYSKWEMTADPGHWLAVAAAAIVPAYFWAAALTRYFPRLTLRIAGLLTHRAFAYTILAAGGALVLWAATHVLGPRALDFDETTLDFQARIFARGRLAAPAVAGEENLDTAFFRAKTEVMRGGRWFSIYPPLHPALLAAGKLFHWPKAPGVLASFAGLFLVLSVGRREFGALGSFFAVAFTAFSPFFVFVQASYLSEATFIFWVGLAWWAASYVPSYPRLAFSILGLALGAAWLTREYGALIVAPGVLWLAARRRPAEVKNVSQWFAFGILPFLAAWVFYNWRQTGNLFLPPRFFSDISHVGYDERFTPLSSLSALARNLAVLSTDAFGWPCVCLLPAVLRFLMIKRPLSDWEKASYATVLIAVVAHLPIRNAGISYGARYYYGAWFSLVFITTSFFVILAATRPPVGEGFAAALAVALIGINLTFYLPRVTARYAGRPWGNYSLWVDGAGRRAIESLGIKRAVVVVRPREWCLSSIPGSPFLDDEIIFARDAGPRNASLKRLFPDRDIYVLDLRRFPYTGEVGLPAAGKTDGVTF